MGNYERIRHRYAPTAVLHPNEAAVGICLRAMKPVAAIELVLGLFAVVSGIYGLRDGVQRREKNAPLILAGLVMIGTGVAVIVVALIQ